MASLCTFGCRNEVVRKLLTNQLTMRNAITKTMDGALALTTSYQVVAQPADLGAVIAHGGQVVLTFARTGGTSVTFKVEEYMGELTGWVFRTEDDGTNLAVIERTSTVASFSYAFSTLAEKIRVSAKGAGSETLNLLMTVGEII
mgnify:FL=1